MSIVGGNWTYSGNPSASAKDSVRFLCGDTDNRDQMLSDEEIEFLVARHSSVDHAAAWACRQMASSPCLVDKSVDGLRISASQRAKALVALATRLENSPTGTGWGVFGGGTLISDRRDRAAEDDYPLPAFRIGDGDNPAAGNQAGSG